MDFINGSELHAALPIYAGHDTPKEWVVMVRIKDDVYGRYVTARMSQLTDSSWSWGNYFSEPGPAMADAYLRAGIENVPVKTLREIASQSRVS